MSSKKIHPLLSALVGELQSEAAWPLERRIAWLKMAGMAFDLVHGQQLAIEIGTLPLMAAGADPGDPGPGIVDFNAVRAAGAVRAARAPVGAPRLSGPLAADQVYYIDLAGKVFGPNGRMHQHELAAEATLWDMRPGEQGLDNVEWADGARGMPPNVPLMVLKG